MTVDRLTAINRADLYRPFKLEGAAPLLHPLFTPLARWFARIVAGFDEQVGVQGLRGGSTWLLHRLSMEAVAHHPNRVPQEGPVLLLANHPGIADTVALFSCLPRIDDLRVIAARRPFLNELPNTSRYLIYVDEEDDSQRPTVLRASMKHLRAGGMLATFPGGHIEPDPAFTPQAAADALGDWEPSITLFIRRIPDLVVVPTLISGVFSEQARRNPLAKIYPDQATQEWVAATLQVILPFYRHVTIDVTFGRPIEAATLAGISREEMMTTITDEMRYLIGVRGNI